MAAGVSASFTIRFSPTSPDTKTATLTITSNDPDESPFTLNLTGTDKTLTEQWRSDFFSVTTNTGDAADLADPDHDGLNNLLERAFNLNPTQSGRPILVADTGTTGLPLIRRTGEPPVFSIQYLRRKASSNSGLTYTPQFGSSIADNGPNGWATATGTETVQSIDAEWERVTIQEEASGKDKRFGRVKVTAVP